MADEHKEGRSDSWNELNELTLSVMANRTKYDKCKKTLANTTDMAQEAFRKEKVYYKDRILNMTKDLFHEHCENDAINDAHREYIKACIEYLKWNDITEMVNKDTRNEIIESSNLDAPDLCQARNDLQEKIQSIQLNYDTGPDADTEHAADNDDEDSHEEPRRMNSSQVNSSNIMSIANKMCIRKKTIDDFIVLKPRMDDEENINARLPKVRDYQTEITKRVVAAAASVNPKD